MKFAPLVVLFVAVVLLAACGGGGSFSPSSSDIATDATAMALNQQAEQVRMLSRLNAQRATEAAVRDEIINATATQRAIDAQATVEQRETAKAEKAARDASATVETRLSWTPTPEPTRTPLPTLTATPIPATSTSTPIVAASDTARSVIVLQPTATATKTAVQEITESPDAGRMAILGGMLLCVFVLICLASWLGRIAIRQWRQNK